MTDKPNRPNWIDALPPGQMIPLPSDPAELTAEHVAAVVADPTALRDLVRLAMDDICMVTTEDPSTHCTDAENAAKGRRLSRT